MTSYTAIVFQLTSRHDPISDFLHRHIVPTNKSSRPHNGIFLIVKTYKVVTVRSDFHDNLSDLKNVFFFS
jgi:hypothetical protein